MTDSFRTPVKLMDERQKEWFATVMVAMVLADGNVSEGEVETLMRSIAFVKEPESVERLKKFIQFRTAPPIAAFVGWDKEFGKRAAILLDLIELAVADRDFSPGEKKKFYEIGNLLGFPHRKIDELVALGPSFMD